MLPNKVLNIFIEILCKRIYLKCQTCVPDMRLKALTDPLLLLIILDWLKLVFDILHKYQYFSQGLLHH